MSERHPAAVAWDEWIAGAGSSACEPYDFTLTGHRQYLENRLARAFQAGYDAAVPKDKTPRVERMIAMRQAGKCLKAIAQEFRISRQRVHQIMKAAEDSEKKATAQ